MKSNTARKRAPRIEPRSRGIAVKTTSAPAVKSGRRTDARSAVRTRLLAAAHELFAKVGFEACTTTEIAVRANVSQRTFFRYFPSKEHAILEWFDLYNVKICDRLRRRPPEESELEVLRRALDHFCHLTPQDAGRVQLIRKLAAESTTLRSSLLNKQSEWEEHIAAVLSERKGRHAGSDYRSKFLAGFAMSVLVTAFREVGAGENALTVEDIVDLGFATMRGVPG